MSRQYIIKSPMSNWIKIFPFLLSVCPYRWKDAMILISASHGCNAPETKVLEVGKGCYFNQNTTWTFVLFFFLLCHHCFLSFSGTARLCVQMLTILCLYGLHSSVYHNKTSTLLESCRWEVCEQFHFLLLRFGCLVTEEEINHVTIQNIYFVKSFS